jgi:hypothetical protein
MTTIPDNDTKLLSFISQKYEAGELDDDSLVKIIKLCGKDYLNLKTISKYANDNKLSYPGAKKCRKPIELFGVKFIIDNE